MIDNKLLLNVLSDIEKEIYTLNKPKISLMEGTPGPILFLNQYYKIKQDTNILKYRDMYIDRLLNLVGDADNLSITYCDGLIGFLSFIRLLNVENEVSYYDFAEDTDEYFFEIMCQNLMANKLDFLHGALGIFWHYVIMACTSKNSNELCRLQIYLQKGVEIIEEVAIKDNLGYRWKSPIKQNLLPDGNVYNLGFAHGQPGILALVSLASNFLKEKHTAFRIMRESSRFITGLHSEHGLSQFPSHFTSGLNTSYESRLAWCYGDLSISLGLLFAAESLGDRSLRDMSEAIAIKSTNRKTIADTSVFDAGLCHGSAGLSHMYGIWYQKTGQRIFKNAQTFWLSKTIRLSSNQDGLAGFKTYVKEDEWEKDVGLLKGISGIGLAIISYIKNTRGWDTLLMLS